MKRHAQKYLGFLFSLFLCTYACAQTREIHTLKFANVQQTMDYFRYSGDGFVIISGHRGGALKGFAENSIDCFEHTLANTPAIFEVDPRLTTDSGIVLLHDATLNRTTNGNGPVKSYTLHDATKLQLKDPEGNLLSVHPPTLEEAINWAKGKTIINLDVKDVPLQMKVDLVRRLNGFPYVMFTVHNAGEAKFFYDYDQRSLFSAWILTSDAFDAYDKAGIPWSNILIAYIGPELTADNLTLLHRLHKKGVMVMVGAGPSFDKLNSPEERKAAYQSLIKSGVDVIESDRPIEVAQAIQSLYPTNSDKYQYWGKVQLNN